jgi:hypothetical protein
LVCQKTTENEVSAFNFFYFQGLSNKFALFVLEDYSGINQRDKNQDFFFASTFFVEKGNFALHLEAKLYCWWQGDQIGQIFAYKALFTLGSF